MRTSGLSRPEGTCAAVGLPMRRRGTTPNFAPAHASARSATFISTEMLREFQRPPTWRPSVLASRCSSWIRKSSRLPSSPPALRAGVRSRRGGRAQAGEFLGHVDADREGGGFGEGAVAALLGRDAGRGIAGLRHRCRLQGLAPALQEALLLARHHDGAAAGSALHGEFAQAMATRCISCSPPAWRLRARAPRAGRRRSGARRLEHLGLVEMARCRARRPCTSSSPRAPTALAALGSHALHACPRCGQQAGSAGRVGAAARRCPDARSLVQMRSSTLPRRTKIRRHDLAQRGLERAKFIGQAQGQVQEAAVDRAESRPGHGWCSLQKVPRRVTLCAGA